MDNKTLLRLFVVIAAGTAAGQFIAPILLRFFWASAVGDALQ